MDVEPECTNQGPDILIEFLEVAIHNVLYVRNIYPESIYVRRQKYGVPVKVSIHPHLNEYITECLKAVREMLKKNEIRKLVITFFNVKHRPIERFIFDILEIGTAININDPYFIKGEEALRGFCLKLAVIGNYLKPLPEGSTFSIQIHTTEAVSVSLGEDPNFQNFPWIEADKQQTEMLDPNIVPIRTMDTVYLKLQMYVEESAEK